MIVTADLHIHSPYSKHGQYQVDFSILGENASKKGIDVLGTGDCLHPQWLQQIKELHRADKGTFKINKTHFILTTEIETIDKVHHLLFFPSINAIDDFKQKIHDKYSNNMETHGRATIYCTSEQLAQQSLTVDALIGPAHILDAQSGIYSNYESLYDCYKSMYTHISFIELGLGTDTIDADTISELHALTFLTNSDTHNPHPIRLGREFTPFFIWYPQSHFHASLRA